MSRDGWLYAQKRWADLSRNCPTHHTPESVYLCLCKRDPLGAVDYMLGVKASPILTMVEDRGEEPLDNEGRVG